MNGIYINLSGKDLNLYGIGSIEKLENLITPSHISSPKSEVIDGYILMHGDDEEKLIRPTVLKKQEYTKYPFTQDQIQEINKMAAGRTRFLILDPRDAEHWSSGKFDPPFRNYRLFSYIEDENEMCKLIEYPIPLTIQDYIVGGVHSTVTASKKFYNRITTIKENNEIGV